MQDTDERRLSEAAPRISTRYPTATPAQRAWLEEHIKTAAWLMEQDFSHS